MKENEIYELLVEGSKVKDNNLSIKKISFATTHPLLQIKDDSIVKTIDTFISVNKLIFKQFDLSIASLNNINIDKIKNIVNKMDDADIINIDGYNFISNLSEMVEFKDVTISLYHTLSDINDDLIDIFTSSYNEKEILIALDDIYDELKEFDSSYMGILINAYNVYRIKNIPNSIDGVKLTFDALYRSGQINARNIPFSKDDIIEMVNDLENTKQYTSMVKMYKRELDTNFKPYTVYFSKSNMEKMVSMANKKGANVLNKYNTILSLEKEIILKLLGFISILTDTHCIAIKDYINQTIDIIKESL